jgi:putative transposase
MKKTRFTDGQMVTILREADEKSVPEVATKHGATAQTIYAWRKHFGSLEPSEVKRLRQLEHENGRLKKIVADRDLEIDVLNVKPGIHILRQTFCSHLAMRGAPARAIQELAGHQDLATTQRYMHVSPAALDAAIRLLDGVAENRGGIVEAQGTAG